MHLNLASLAARLPLPSSRRNGGLHGMFSTTLTSGLNTGREDMLENTAELRAFTSIDMGKISQDRV